MRKSKNRSTEKSIDNVTASKMFYDRRCQTPSLLNNKKRTKSRGKKQLQSLKIMKPDDKYQKYDKHDKRDKYENYNLPLHHHLRKESPFKHKSRPGSNLSNLQLKHIEHQLSNLGDPDHKRTEYPKSFPTAKRYMYNHEYKTALPMFQAILKQQPSIEVMYLIGVCSFHLEQYPNVIQHLNNVIIQDESYRKNVYLFLAISYKKVGIVDEALLMLGKAINLYPKYYDAIILRAKILAKQKRFYDAIQDLNRCIKIDPKNLQAFISKADCLRSLSRFPEAVKIYTEVLGVHFEPEIVLKRAIANIEGDEIQEALQDLNGLIAKQFNNSEAYLFKGMAYTRSKNYNQAILSYEQAIKFNSSKKATTKALYEIAKLKIQMGDFYGASYTLERGGGLQVETKVLEKVRMFTEGATLIMKKKYKKGIENMSYLARKDHINEQIRPLLYSFRSYANFCQYKFASALNDLKAMAKVGYLLDKASEYNYVLLEGIIACQNNAFLDAAKQFDTATKLRPDFAEPIIYKGLAKVCEFNRTPKNRNYSLLEEALQLVSDATEKQEHYNLHYLLAAIMYQMNEIGLALEHINKAIDKSDQHIIKHFYLRGLIRVAKHKEKEGFNDFSSAITLMTDLKDKEQSPEEPREKDIVQAYLNRAKCYLLFGDKKKAFQDLQTYISCKPLDSEIHTVAGKLLFSIGACDDAIKAYNYSPNIDKNRQCLLERAKCFLILKQLNLCLKDMEKLIQLGDDIVKVDYCTLAALKEASKGQIESYKEAFKKITLVEGLEAQNGHIFKQSDIFFYKGHMHFLLGQYAAALRQLNKSKAIKTINHELEENDPQDPKECYQNRIYTQQQINYNIGLCQLMLGSKQAALKHLGNYDGFTQLLKGQLIAEDIDLTPFPIANRLCSIFPSISYAGAKLNFSFCLPTVLPPEIRFDTQHRIIQELNMASTEAKPDAPWIKRNNEGVIFTDQMINFDIDIDMQTEQSAKPVDEVRIEEESFSANKEKIREIFSLDRSVEERIEKLINKQK